MSPSPGRSVTWQRASRCAAGQCIQVANVGGDIWIGDTKTPDGPVLRYSPEEWTAFVTGIKDGEFDGVATSSGHPAGFSALTVRGDGTHR